MRIEGKAICITFSFLELEGRVANLGVYKNKFIDTKNICFPFSQLGQNPDPIPRWENKGVNKQE